MPQLRIDDHLPPRRAVVACGAAEAVGAAALVVEVAAVARQAALAGAAAAVDRGDVGCDA